MQQTADFVFTNETLKHCFSIQLIDDDLDENNELFLIELSGPSDSSNDLLCATNGIPTSPTSNETEFDIFFSASVTIIDDGRQHMVFTYTHSS